MGDYDDFLKSTGKEDELKWTRCVDPNTQKHYFVSSSGEESIWADDPHAPTNYHDLSSPEWSSMPGNEHQEVKKKSGSQKKKTTKRDKKVKHSSHRTRSSAPTSGVPASHNTSLQSNVDDDTSLLLDFDPSPGASVQNRDPYTRVLADTEADLTSYRCSSRLHAVLVEAPLAMCEAWVRVGVCLYVGFMQAAVFFIWHRHDTSYRSNVLGWFREAFICAVAALTLLIPGWVLFVYRDIGRMGTSTYKPSVTSAQTRRNRSSSYAVDPTMSWQLQALPSVVGRIDPRRFATFVYGLGATADGLDPPDEERDVDGADVEVGVGDAGRPTECMDSLPGRKNYCYPRSLVRKFTSFCEQARRGAEPEFVRDMRVRRSLDGSGGLDLTGVDEDEEVDEDEVHLTGDSSSMLRPPFIASAIDAVEAGDVELSIL